jgi:hypothetical protein
VVGPVRAYGAWDARQQKGIRFVYSEDDWRRAITSLIAQTTTVGGRLFSGGGIAFGGSFTVSRPLAVPVDCGGLTIFAPARYPITAKGVVSSLFEVAAPLVTIRDLFCASKSTTNMFTTFVTVTDDGADQLRVLDNYVVADRIYVESATDPNDCTIRGNIQSEVNGSHDAPIVVHGGGSFVECNKVADGGGDGITVGAGGDFVTIVGNHLRGSDITTSASDGYNTISANKETGTITAHAADDTLGGNT